MNEQAIIERTTQYVRGELEGEGSGHDWWHVYRVWKSASIIAREEKADVFVVELAALLHDIADHKFHGGDHSVGPRKAREWLEGMGVEEEVISHVCVIIGSVSFSKGLVPETLEGKIVQDADRMDAIGAIGLARAFAYGGHKGRSLYDPNDISPEGTASINHFYAKLLLIKDKLHTDQARQIAEGRHRFMEEFLGRFYKEWEGES